MHEATVKTVSDWEEIRWAALRPLSLFPDPASPRRISLVTDSIGPSSLFGGVGTALILATQWAQRSEAVLRVVTRTEAPVTTALSSLLEANCLSFTGEVEFVHAPHFNSAALALGERDLFLATSWWSARCLLNSVSADRIVYLLQEDERMFYPHGDDHLACSETLAEPFAQVVVNSALLHRHLTRGEGAIARLAERSVHFEPAFPYARAACPARSEGAMRKLFFYARPQNLRNLYATGMNLLNQAAVRGVIDKTGWEVHLVGRGLEPLQFDGGLKAVYHEPMAWKDYARFLQDMDAGLSLMYTPHPSYPPIDLAAMGVPVLTNRFGIKTDLDVYSKNILTADLPLPSMLDGLGRLIALAEDPATVAHNLETDRINRDWTTALAPVVERLAQISDARG